MRQMVRLLAKVSLLVMVANLLLPYTSTPSQEI